jgi:glycosyltransferase involved in cell wall biosynthesis
MRIAVVSTRSDGTDASRAARALHLEFRRLGHDSQMLVMAGAEEPFGIVALAVDASSAACTRRTAWEDANRRIAAESQLAGAAACRFSLPGPGYDLASHPIIRAAEIVSLHDVAGVVSPESVRALLEAGKPVVWTLHDRRPFTGGCHDPAGCTRFESDCAECPQLAPSATALARRAATHARELFDATRVTVVAPTRELANEARRSRMFGASRVHVVSHGGEGAPALLRIFEELAGESPRGDADRAGAGASPALAEVCGFLEWTEPSPPRQAVQRPQTRPPDVLWQADAGSSHRPSWSGHGASLGPEHDGIWDATKDLPGRQERAESQKLYEMAYHAGEVILEIGVHGGRSAVVELKGALAAARRRAPQLFGVDVDPSFVGRTLPVLERAGIAEHCLLYTGNLEGFLHDIPIVPTMVFVHGDHRHPGVKADLDRLAAWLAPGTPVLCHDYVGTEGVRRAVDEAVAAGGFTAAGLFGCSTLLVARGDPAQSPRGLPAEIFAETRTALLAAYERSSAGLPARSETAALATLRAHESLVPRTGPATSRAPWPRAAPPVAPLPPTLPSGRPWPKFSIVTPSFNQGAYVEETILSVLNQGYPNVEHIVVDGGSSDETVEVLARYRDRLALCIREPDRGQSHALNKGFARATGEILTWLNSDDMLAPGALAAAALAFDRAGADMVAGVCQIYEDGWLRDAHLTSCRDGLLPIDDLLDLERCWLAGQFFYQPEVFFTRDVWDRAGGFVDGSVHFSMDYDLWVRFALERARLHVIGRPLARFRAHPGQKTHTVDAYRPELEQVCARHLAQRPACPAGSGQQRRRGPLRVAMVNDLGFNLGAGIGHGRIALALTAAGHTVLPLAVHPDPLDAARRATPFADQILPRLRRMRPDVVVVGNVHSAGIEPGTVEEIAREFATVFTLHDAWMLTGRCAYRGGCERHLTGCDEKCPTAGEYPPLSPEAIGAAWRSKRRLLQGSSALALAANSKWMLEEIARVADAARADGDAPVRRARLLHLGLPLDVFQPRDMTVCREALGLPQDRFVILFSSSTVTDPRKGADHLVKALRQLRIPHALPVAIGRVADESALAHAGVHFTGYVHDPRVLAMLYSAADVFVAPSLEESFGQVLIEAAACGTPSVGYAVGGITDAIADGTSGLLARSVAPESLADAITELYEDAALRRQLGVWGRLHVENEFSLERSYHHAHGALADALSRAGVSMVPKISFPPGTRKLPKVEYLLAEPGHARRNGAANGEAPLLPGTLFPVMPADEPVETVVLRYFTGRLNEIRSERAPWYLRPSAWVTRMSRQLMRREVKRIQRPNGALDGRNGVTPEMD